MNLFMIASEYTCILCMLFMINWFQPNCAIPILARTVADVYIRISVTVTTACVTLDTLGFIASSVRPSLHVAYSFMTEICIAPLQGYYSEAIPTLARLKRRVLRLE